MMKEEITNIIRTFEAVGPILGNAMKSGQLFEPQCELSERDPDVLCEYDVRIPMSEGFSVTANIFRSKKAGEASPDDMALFIAVNKLDKDGKPVHFNGSVGIDWDMVTRGWCKVSRRELDPVVSTEWQPGQWPRGKSVALVQEAQ